MYQQSKSTHLPSRGMGSDTSSIHRPVLRLYLPFAAGTKCSPIYLLVILFELLLDVSPINYNRREVGKTFSMSTFTCNQMCCSLSQLFCSILSFVTVNRIKVSNTLETNAADNKNTITDNSQRNKTRTRNSKLHDESVFVNKTQAQRKQPNTLS